MIVSVLDEKLTHIRISSCIPPLKPADVIGKPPWHFLDAPEEKERVKSLLARCVLLDESHVYTVHTSFNKTRLVWSVRADRIPCGVLLMSVVVPEGFDLLTDRELAVLQHARLGLSQGQIAKLLRVTRGTVSRTEEAIRKKLGHGATRAALFGFQMPDWT
jgi:DNA-binding NarL/FixJ family response regulator